MKYRCKMCGYEGEGTSLPTIECPSCGMEGEWEACPFDARCPKCGQGYYESEKPNFCPTCGNRIAAPRPTATVRKARQEWPKNVNPSAPSASPYLSWLKIFFKILAWLVAIGLVCWAGYYVVIWAWTAICFIALHWIISLVVLSIVIGIAAKK